MNNLLRMCLVNPNSMFRYKLVLVANLFLGLLIGRGELIR
jgi:hypothetical protein